MAKTAVKTKKRPLKRTPSEWVLDICKVVFLSLVTIVTVYPFWNIFIVSINDPTDAVRGGLYFWPRVFSVLSYKEILGRSTFTHSILVTLARTIIGTPLALLCTSMVAYSLSRKELIGHKFWNVLFVFTMYFGGGSEKSGPAGYFLGIHFPADHERIQHDSDPLLYRIHAG